MIKIAFIAFFTLVSVLPAEAQRAVRPTGIFSNMETGADGEAIGTEIFVTESAGNHWALVQHAKYGVNLVVLVKAKVEGSKISFDLPFESSIVVGSEGGRKERIDFTSVWRFEGEFKEDRLVGRFNGADWETLNLARGKSYWQ